MFASLARPDDDAELHWLKVLAPRIILTLETYICVGWPHKVHNWLRGVVALPPEGPTTQ